MKPAVGQVWRLAPQLARRLVRVDAERVEWVTLAAPGSRLDGQRGGTTRAMWDRWVRTQQPSLDASARAGHAVDAAPKKALAPLGRRGEQARHAENGRMPDEQEPTPTPASAPGSTPIRLSPRAATSLRSLLSIADGSGLVAPRCRAQLHEAAGQTEPTFRRGLGELQFLGLVVVEPGARWEATRYRVSMESASASLALASASGDAGAERDARQVTQVTHRATASPPLRQVTQGDAGVTQGDSRQVTQVTQVTDAPIPEYSSSFLSKKEEREEEGASPPVTHVRRARQVTQVTQEGDVRQVTQEGDAGGALARLSSLLASVDEVASVLGPERVAAWLRSTADLLAPSVPSAAPSASTGSAGGHAPRQAGDPLAVKDYRGWTGYDAQGPCVADPSHGPCLPRMTKTEPRTWIAFCRREGCGSVRDPAKLEAARVAALHPEAAPPRRPGSPPPVEESMADRWARDAARTREDLGERLVTQATGAGGVAHDLAAIQASGSSLRDQIEAARAKAKPLIRQRRPSPKEMALAALDEQKERSA